jgi:hypothetical protein
MTPQQYLDGCIIPAAKALNVYTLPHLQIGFDTAAQETQFEAVRQTGGGPALGPFQMEPATHLSLWENYIDYRPRTRAALLGLLGAQPVPPPAEIMLTNLPYAAAMMFCRYLDAPGEIPLDLDGQADYYLRNYNAGGKATKAEYLANHARFVPQVVFPNFGVTT